MEKGYAPVHGLDLYYEVHGVASPTRMTPLLLLHGGGDTIETSFGRVLPELARGRQVVAFERQGYGRTADIPGRRFGFEQSADDAAALMGHLGIETADLLGFSNGGTLALHIAIRHPRLARRLVIVSGLFGRKGADPAFWKGFGTANLEAMPRELREAYLRVAPRREGLQSMFDKSVQLMRDFKDIPADAIREVGAPVLVVCGDSDVVRAEHAVELFRLLPHARLAVLPGTDHMSVMERAWLVPMVEEFLDR